MSEIRILAIDPGSTQSAAVEWVIGKGMCGQCKVDNEVMLENLIERTYDFLVIEKMSSYGMAVGQEVFDTCIWIGRFIERARSLPHVVKADLVGRKTIAAHHCGTAKANDSNVRAALIERLGPKGTAKNPGPTFGISKDMWSALAIALYKADQLDPTQGSVPESRSLILK